MLRNLFDIEADDVEFVPVGYVAACYVLRRDGEPRYFLKLWPDTATGRESAASLDVTLPLLRALHERGLRARVPSPTPTREGRLSATCDGAPFAVFPFLPGSTPAGWPEWPPAVWDEMARTLAEIHGATSSVHGVALPRETFDIPFETDLRAGLARLERIGPAARRGLRELRDLVLPRRAEILEQLARLAELQGPLRRLGGPVVLCHTDFGGDNLLVDEHGRLSVLDWDEAKLGPPEHDLRIGIEPAGGTALARFLTTYIAAGGTRALSVDRFAFFLRRRAAEDLSARLVQILDEQPPPSEESELLEGIVRWGFDQWALIDERIAAIGAALHDLA